MEAVQQAYRKWAEALAEKEQRDREARETARQTEDPSTEQGA